MSKPIQKLPQILWVYIAPYKVLLTDPHYYVWFWVDGIKKRSIALASAEEALQKVASAEQKGYGAFASGPIPANNNQHGVFAITAAGETKSVFMSKYYKVIEDAKFSVIGKNKVTSVSAKETKLQIISDKEDPKRMVVIVKYEENTEKVFTFRCRKAHVVGDFVAVKTKRSGEAKATIKNVKVVEFKIVSESWIKKEAEALGYSDLSEVYCDEAIDIPEAWEKWQPQGFLKRIPANGVFSEEEMEEAQARVEQMKLVI